MRKHQNTIRWPAMLVGLWLLPVSPARLDAATIDFEDLPLSGENTAIAEPFQSGGASFPGEIVFDCCWSGWVYSNSTLNQDLGVSPGTVPSSDAQQRAQWSTAYVPPSGSNSNYAVASFVDAQIVPTTGRTANNLPFILPPGETIASLEVANTTWAAYSMLIGDDFGGPFSNGDFFRLSITGMQDSEVVGTVHVSLAEGRDILADWTEVSLSDLHGSNQIVFSLASSDTTSFGDTSFLNTPVFFAVDNIVTIAIPEASGFALTICAMLGLQLTNVLRHARRLP